MPSGSPHPAQTMVQVSAPQNSLPRCFQTHFQGLHYRPPRSIVPRQTQSRLGLETEVGCGAGVSTRTQLTQWGVLPPYRVSLSRVRGWGQPPPRPPPLLRPHVKVPTPLRPPPTSVTRASYALRRAQRKTEMWGPLFEKQEECATQVLTHKTCSFLPWSLSVSPSAWRCHLLLNVVLLQAQGPWRGECRGAQPTSHQGRRPASAGPRRRPGLGWGGRCPP